MVERGYLKSYILLLCICINLTFGLSTKGHSKQHLENLQNSPQRNEEVEQGRGEIAPERGQAVPGRGETAPERGQAVPGRGETAPERGHGETAPGRGETLPERGEKLPGQDEAERGQSGRDEFLPGPAGGGATGKPGRKCTCDCTNILETPHGSYKLEKGFGYYKYHNHGKNWFAAKKECEKEGAHLVIINSAKERDLLLKIYKEKPAHGKNPAIFVGINDLVQDGKWVTVFDEPLDKTGFTNWNEHEPSGKANQNCGALQAEAGKLHDHECGNELGFICEREADYIPHCY
ncbi:hypothetical protein C0J52_15833 [Blattella germanica]|nr:hypothetical protein C0J52_15833 [Blattella germanica]